MGSQVVFKGWGRRRTFVCFFNVIFQCLKDSRLRTREFGLK